MNTKETLFVIYLAVLLASALMALLHLKHMRGKGLALFAPYLCYVFIQEFGNHYFFATFFPGMTNDILYNIHRVVTVLFFSFMYYRVPLMKPVRKIIALLAVLYSLAFLLTFGFLQPIFDYNGYLSLARGFVLSVTGLLFLFCYFHLDNRTEEKASQPWLWITIGLLLFYPVISISQIFTQYLYTEDILIYGIRLYNLIPQVMSIFMYSCFAYAFYLCRKKK